MSSSNRASDEQVAVAAFHLWEREGRPDGKAEEHWHRARAMLEARETFTAEAAAPEPAATSPARKRAAATANPTPRARKPRTR